MGEFFVYSFFFGALLFFLPVFVTAEAFVNVGENKAWFAVSPYKIKLFGGYAQLGKEGIAVHLTEKKAVFIYYRQMAETKKKFEITQGFQLWEYRQVIETGGAETPLAAIYSAGIQSVCGALFSVLQTRYPFLSLKNSVLLAETPCLKLTIKSTVVFNGLVLTVAIAKKILEAIINWIRKRRSIRFWKKQPSN